MSILPDQLIKDIKHPRLPFKVLIKRALFIILGAIFMGVGLEEFLVQNNILDGGIVGISIILSYLTGWKLGLIIFILNIPFFYLGYKQIGKTFALSSLLAVAVLSLTTGFLHDLPVFTDDLLLATVFGGITIGIGVGLVIRNGGSLDGTEILAIMITKKSPFSVGEIIMFFNIFIFVLAGFVFTWDRAMYSIITYFVAFKTIDVVLQGFEDTKSAWIISEEYRAIGEAIIARLGRGVTYLSGEGAYTGDNKKVIFCVVSRLEEAKLKSIIEEKDPSAFLAVSSITEVRGGRFKKKDIH
jgi:uncharacterized membrane-anchored protein YitT (DUF2179 family)